MKVLLLEDVHPKTMEWLILQKSIEVFHVAQEDLFNYFDVEAIITRGIGKINKELVDKCPNLRVVARCGVGLDNVDVDYCTTKSIKVIYAPGSNTQTTAEHTMSLMLNLQRNIFNALQEVKRGNWQHRNHHQSDEIYGKTLGILGFGNIGQKVATMASAFGMKVQYWSRSPHESVFPYLPLDKLIMESDIITVHLPLNTETKGFISADFIRRCKKGVLFINTARADIFDKLALLSSLDNGQIGGYAADVPQSPYPSKDDELNNHPNTLITAHVSSLTDNTFYNMCQMTLENVIKVLAHEDIDRKFIRNYTELI
jgi:D-3-phosphoglycerate dehydrogenase / 2-oxoglutarate reductase